MFGIQRVLTMAAAMPALAAATEVARLPFLGYNTWNRYGCDINETLIVETAQAMKDLGLQDLGYNYVNLDDCWSLKNRSADGRLVPDPIKFPSGIANLSSVIHGMGFKLGIYGDAGYGTCAGYPGSFGYEQVDAETWAGWGVKLLKYDNCYIPEDRVVKGNVRSRYIRMRDALNNVAEQSGADPIVYSLCPWGWDAVWEWGKEVGQSWRTTGDINPWWGSLASIINRNSFITAYADFGAHNDLDMLQIGNGNLTVAEAQSHFTAWAFMKSPLLIGTDMSALAPEFLEVLSNQEIIEINQDPVYGKSISPFRWGINPDWTWNETHPAQYWSGQSQNGTIVMLINTLDTPATLFFNLTESPWLLDGYEYAVRDLWAHKELGYALRNWTQELPPHGVAALLMHDPIEEPADTWPLCAEWFQCSLPNLTRLGL